MMLELLAGSSTEEVDQHRRNTLEAYIKLTGAQPRLDIPVSPLRYIFLPPRLLDVMAKGPNLDVYLIEGLDPELLSANVGSLKNGRIDPLIEIQLKAYQTPHGTVLRLNHFLDDLRIRGRHVSSQLLERVSEFAAMMGFIGINAFNNSSNIGFFRDRLGWATVDRMHPALARELVPDLCNLNPKYVTYQHLQKKR